MATNAKPVYKRILLKLSGEALQGTEGFGIDASILDRMAQEIKELVELGIQVGVVIGGGNLFRGAGLAKAGMNRVVGDHMGMLATVMNGLAMRDALHRAYVNARLMSAIPLNGVCDSYSWAEAISLLRNNRVVILSAGTGNPFFSTDTAAALRANEIEADIMMKATMVDGVYDSDPKTNPNAKKYDVVSFHEVLNKDLAVMDSTAASLCKDNKLPVLVFSLEDPENIYRAVCGENIGTVVDAID